jgi:hypothetical protein
LPFRSEPAVADGGRQPPRLLNGHVSGAVSQALPRFSDFIHDASYLVVESARVHAGHVITHPPESMFDIEHVFDESDKAIDREPVGEIRSNRKQVSDKRMAFGDLQRGWLLKGRFAMGLHVSTSNDTAIPFCVA